MTVMMLKNNIKSPFLREITGLFILRLMKSIHGSELFNFAASAREGLKETFGFAISEIPVAERAAHLRHAGVKSFRIDPQALNKATDEQVICSLGYADMKRAQSRNYAQMGMAFILAGAASPLVGLGVAFPIVYGAYGLYKLFSSRKEEQTAYSCAVRGASCLQDTPKYNAHGELQLIV